MSAFRFVHSSDLHLGRAFAGYPEGIWHRLREVRYVAIVWLARTLRVNVDGLLTSGYEAAVGALKGGLPPRAKLRRQFDGHQLQ